MEPIAVTGVGAVTCLGPSAATTWRGLIEGRSGIRAITRFPTAELASTIAGCVETKAPDHDAWSRAHAMADPELDLDYVPNRAIERRFSIAISSSFGLGGQDVSLVLGAAP